VNPINHQLEVKFISKTKGKGVFAKKDIPKGQIIERAQIVLISNDDWVLIEETVLSNYTFEWDDPKHKGVYDSAISLSISQFINHSYTPNTKYNYNYNDEVITYITIQDISKGEEITVNYNGDPYDNSPVGFKVE
jgi:SET domain-containing protein